MSAEINNLPEQRLEDLDPSRIDPFDLVVMAHQVS